MCSGSVVLTTPDIESGRQRQVLSVCQYAIRLDHCTGFTRSFIPLGYYTGIRVAAENKG